jgi:CrcB protein
MIAGRFLLVCLGGAIGTAARYATALWVPTMLGTSFPFATMIINAAGSFGIAFIMQLGFSPDIRAMLTTGVMGGFTTYSTFNYESTQLLRDGAWLLGITNIVGTVVICLAAGICGAAVGRMIVGR